MSLGSFLQTKNPIRPQRCERCPYKSRTCGTKGPVDSPFVIVGESPGNNEIMNNAPFSGEGGKFLESCFPVDSGIEPYYINAVSCLPVKKDKDNLANACQACSSRLLEEIKAFPRKVILALGNGAMWGLTGDNSLKITAERGKIFPSSLSEHGIVASTHPAFILRGGGSQRLFKQDVGLAWQLLQSNKSPFTYVDTDLVLMEDEADIRELIYLASKEEYIAGDIETSAFKYLSGHILSQGFCFNPKEAYVVPPHLFKYVGQIYNPEVVKAKWIWHNGKFDVGWLRYEAERHWGGYDYFIQVIRHVCAQYGYRNGYETARVDEDTMLLSYAIEETRGIHDLESVGNDYIGAPNWKAMVEQWLPKKGASYANIPPVTLYKYQAKDLGVTYQVFPILRAKVKDDPILEKLYTRTLIPGSELLTWVERNGFAVDKEQIAHNKKVYGTKTDKNLPGTKIAEALDQVNQESLKVLGKTINPGSWQQVQKLIYVGGLDLAHGRVLGTDKDTLEQILEPHPCTKAILEYRALQKMIGTYIDGLEDQIQSDGRIHCSFLLHGTTSGRLSCRDPNLQNIDRDPDIRNEFMASAGKILYELDLNQAELRSLACLSACPSLCSIYLNKGESIHNIVSRKFFSGWQPEGHPDHNHEQYMLAKTITFGIVYGREAFSIAMKFGITHKEAQMYIDGWFDQFPGAHDFIQKCRMAPLRGKILKTPFGYKRRFGKIGQDKIHDVQNQAANFPHQNIASSINLHGAMVIMPTLKRWNVKMVDLVHDSIMLEMDDNQDLMGEVKRLAKREIEAIPPLWGIDRVPFVVDAKKGKRWGDFEKDH